MLPATAFPLLFSVTHVSTDTYKDIVEQMCSNAFTFSPYDSFDLDLCFAKEDVNKLIK